MMMSKADEGLAGLTELLYRLDALNGSRLALVFQLCGYWNVFRLSTSQSLFQLFQNKY